MKKALLRNLMFGFTICLLDQIISESPLKYEEIVLSPTQVVGKVVLIFESSSRSFVMLLSCPNAEGYFCIYNCLSTKLPIYLLRYIHHIGLTDLQI